MLISCTFAFTWEWQSQLILHILPESDDFHKYDCKFGCERLMNTIISLLLSLSRISYLYINDISYYYCSIITLDKNSNLHSLSMKKGGRLYDQDSQCTNTVRHKSRLNFLPIPKRKACIIFTLWLPVYFRILPYVRVQIAFKTIQTKE